MHVSGPVRVLVVHSSTTGGHASAAAALVDSLNAMPDVEASSLNTLSVSSQSVRKSQDVFYDLVSNKMPWLRRLGFSMAIDGMPLAREVGNLAMAAKAWMSDEVLEEIQQRKPDLIVSTHSQTNAMLEHWKRNGDIDAPVHSVLTDFMAHGLWAQDSIERYYVASDTVRADLERFGVDPSRVSVSGIPIRPYQHPVPSEQIERSRLGLDPKLPMVLLTGGSLGLQPYADLVKALDASPTPMQIVAVTARNDAARKELEAMQTRHPLRVEGLVDNMDMWTRAADVVVGKPGGLTASETFAMGKPMVFASPAPGMEERQAERLGKSGVARVAESPRETAESVVALLSDPLARAQASRAVSALGRPEAAHDVAKSVVEAATTRRDGDSTRQQDA